LHLARLSVANFRVFGEPGTDFEFRPGVNVVIGENNVGKSALADAIRLILSLGQGRRELFVTPQDFHTTPLGTVASEIRLHAAFEGLTDEQQGVFYELLALTDPPSAQLHVRYQLDTVNGQQRVRSNVWGGEMEGQPLTGGAQEQLWHVFMGALRDAEADLRPGRGSRLGQLLRTIVRAPEDRNRIAQHVSRANREILNEPEIQRSAETVNRHLAELAGPNLRQTVRVGFLPPTFERVVEALRPLLPSGGAPSFVAVYDIPGWKQLLSTAGESAPVLERAAQATPDCVLVDLAAFAPNELEKLSDPTRYDLHDHVREGFVVDQNGLGYNNLIYMGVVLGDLAERTLADPFSYCALVVEEPEAHLHPQLQVVVSDFLDRTSRAADGRSQVQVFVTSHSPTLTSRADLDSLIVLHKRALGSVSATPIRRIPLTTAEKQDLSRYLDVTRSQLFFARSVLLVEGITEALLLPVLARRTGRRLDHAADEVVNVSGVSFAPFAKLFNSPDRTQRLDIPCALVTDDDRCSERDDPRRLLESDTPAEIAAKLRDGKPTARCLKATGWEEGTLRVFTARKTLELELGMCPQNFPALLRAVREAGHTQVAANLENAATAEPDDWNRAAWVWMSLSGSKAEVAQRLASILSERQHDAYVHEFVVPDYLTKAITYVTSVAMTAEP
jgi:putative ATP-dependent endonuclease of the OLD family